MLVYGGGASVNVCMLVYTRMFSYCRRVQLFMTGFPEHLFSVNADSTTLLQCSTSKLKSRWPAPTANSVWSHLDIAGPHIT